ncbi:MAG: serine hydrolase [Candidatus Aminicenantes bacterium]|nr:serine hydrolase [Candidatus Aminicenantes bacterium]
MKHFPRTHKRSLILTGIIVAVMISSTGVQPQSRRWITHNVSNLNPLYDRAVNVNSRMKGNLQPIPAHSFSSNKMDGALDAYSICFEETEIESNTQHVKTYLDVVNSGDREAIRNYITEHYDPSFLKKLPLDIHILFQMGISYASAGLGYVLREPGPRRTESMNALLYNNLTGSWINLTVPVTKEPPHKINGFMNLEPAPLPSDVPPPEKRSDEAVVERLEICMKKLVADDIFSGVVLLARNGRPLFQKAYGFASRSYRVPNRLDTKFNIASVGKIFTGVAVAQLAERGKLSFEDPLNAYVPSDWLKPEISEKFQIRHLLTHTSGLGNYFQKLYGQYKQLLFRNLDDYKMLISDETLAFEPGTKWAYSSTGMMLLGVVIENVTGESYFDYVRSQIYKPAGMTNTDAFEKDLPVENRASAYAMDYSSKEPVLREVLFTRVMKGMPSGGSYSTAEDLMKFDAALRSHKLLGPEYTETVLTPKPEISAPTHGYGFFVTQTAAGRVASHGGDGSGVNCQFKMYLDSGYTVVVLSNYSPPAANIVEQVIEQMLLAMTY